MRSFEAAAKSSQPVIGLEFVNVIFYKIPELTQIHADFIARLEPTVEKWNPQQEVAEAFKMMVGATGEGEEVYDRNHKLSPMLFKCLCYAPYLLDK